MCIRDRYAVFAMMKSENSNINKGKRYKEAIEYMNNGDFATAEDELNALAEKNYKDSGILAEYAGLRADNAASEKLAEFKGKAGRRELQRCLCRRNVFIFR